MIIAAQLKHIDFLNEQIDSLSLEIKQRLKKDEDLLVLVDSIPGIGERVAEVVFAEAETNMEQFLSDVYLSS